jgi:hypothetical protein
MGGTQSAAGLMSGDHDRCFVKNGAGGISKPEVFFNANALPCINIGADVCGESGIMTGVY